MTIKTKKILLWITRSLGILFGFFLAMFAFDVFDESHEGQSVMKEFLLHLIPAGVVLTSVLLSWKRHWVGLVLFASLATVYIYLSWNRFPVSVYFVIAGPLGLLSLLHLLLAVAKK